MHNFILRMERILILICLVSVPAWGDNTLSLSLRDTELLSLKNSDNLRSQESVTEMSTNAARASKSYLYPKLSIDGYYYNNSVLPEPKIGNTQVPFGAHNNYGVGPTLSYKLFDGGKQRKNYSSLLSVNQARENDEKARRKYVLYQARLAYFDLQFAVQSLKYTAASLRLTKNQGKDIGNRYRTGTASKLDNISAQKDVLVPGVISLLVCIITVILTSMSLAKEKEVGTLEMLLSAPVHINEIILGKSIPFIILGLCNVPLVLLVAILGFNVPMRRPYWMFEVSALVFICTTVSIGIMISTLSKTQQQSMMAGFLFLFLFLFPAIQLSGLNFPVDNMPDWIRFVAYLSPLTYYLEQLRTIMLKGGDYYVFFINNGVLIIMGIFFWIVSFKRFKMTLG